MSMLEELRGIYAGARVQWLDRLRRSLPRSHDAKQISPRGASDDIGSSRRNGATEDHDKGRDGSRGGDSATQERQIPDDVKNELLALRARLAELEAQTEAHDIRELIRLKAYVSAYIRHDSRTSFMGLRNLMREIDW